MKQWLVKNKFRFEKVVLIVWTTFLFVVHFIPGDKIAESNWSEFLQLDKIIHFILFFISAWVYWNFIFLRGWYTFYWLFILSPLVFELLQRGLARQRNFDVWDILADLLGVLLYHLSIVKKWKF